jgi:hypothetical protein
VDAPENSRNAVIEHQKTWTFSRGGLQTLLFSSLITYVLSNGKERKIGASEALQKRLEWENLIFFAAWNANLRLLYVYWISMIPSYMFWNCFCEWLGKTKLCQNLRSSRFKLFWGTPP